MRWGGSDRAESWAWRAVMPALILGGTAAGWTLALVAVLRTFQWRRRYRDDAWSWGMSAPWWMAYFGLNLIGGLWTEHLDGWWLGLEVKTALWFLPVLLAMPGRKVNEDFWWSVGWTMAAFMGWRMLHAAYLQWSTGLASGWSYAGFSGDVHPTYLALHLSVALMGLGAAWGRGLDVRSRMVLGVGFALSIGLTGSKAGILAAAVVLVMRMVLAWKGSGTDERGFGIPAVRPGRLEWAVLLCIMLGAAWWSSRSRFVELGTAAVAISDDKATVNSSSAGRVAVWKASCSLVAEHPMGVGTGDVVPELMRLYAQEGVGYAAERKLNAHNQWLQAGVAFGWPGILVLSMAFLRMLSSCRRQRDGLVLTCVVLVGLHACVESVLEVQRGVVFIMWMFMAGQTSVGGVDRSRWP